MANKSRITKFSPNSLKRILNFYPPYLCSGIKVESISADWKELQVSMRLFWLNRNAVGTHFGGSLYSMIDPHVMLLLMQLLGSEYVVWDQSARIEFVKASKKKVRCVIRIADQIIEEIKRNTQGGEKYLANFDLEIRDEDGVLVARAEKVIYVRKKSPLPDG